jgi:hypothetical protein
MYPPTILAINSAKVFLNRYYMVEPLDNSPDKVFQHKVSAIDFKAISWFLPC